LKELDYSGLTGEIVTKESTNYEDDRKSWNRAISKYPSTIIFCYAEEDIRNSINWCKKNLLEFRIRSGRHHYEGYSTGDDIVVIDVSKMNGIEVDIKQNVVKIQGGVRNREIYETMGNMSYPFPGGGCPTVGVAGLTLGGGWGYSNRLMGLTADSLIELELVDYKGDIIIASEQINEDLFWACRGAGGGNFGVIASMTFKIPPKYNMVTLVDIDYMKINLDEITNIFEIWINFFKDLDRRINLKMSIYNSKIKGKGIRITGLFYGNKEEASKILEPFKNICLATIFDLDYISILEANRRIQDSHPPYEKYKSSGRFIYDDFPISIIKEVAQLVSEREEGSVYTAVTLYGLGGAIKDKHKEDTAFYYRDANFIMGFQSVWEDDVYAKKNIEWVKGKQNYIKSITVGAYVNFPCAELKNYEEEYYGGNLEKLKEIKRKYDPYNIFRFNQGIN
jgi:hypothetical protein